MTKRIYGPWPTFIIQPTNITFDKRIKPYLERKIMEYGSSANYIRCLIEKDLDFLNKK